MKKKKATSAAAATNSSTSDVVDYTTQYAQAVTAGVIVAGPYVRAACARHIKDLKHGRERNLHFDIEAADRFFRFCSSRLCLSAGQFEGKPFNLHISQKFIAGSIFGWKWISGKNAGLRRYRRAYIEEAKGNGKSPLAAAIGIYMMVADGERRAEVYAAGGNKDQAQVIFGDAVAMRDQSPMLRARITKSGRNPVWKMTGALNTKQQGSVFRPISSDKKKSGPRPSCGLCDEIHEHSNGLVLDMLERGFKWRRQPLLFMITNSGSDRNSVCFREHDLAVKVAEGAVEMDHFFSYVCALDPEIRDHNGNIIQAADDPLNDPACWIKVNPLLGVTVTEEELQREADQARAMPGVMNEILRLRFCCWTDADRAWMARATLERVYREFNPWKIHKGRPIYLGLDLSASQDLTAAGLVVKTGEVEVKRPEEDGGGSVKLPTFDGWVEAWTPGDTLHARALRDKAPYDVWVRDGWLRAPKGETIRLDHVAVRVAQFVQHFGVELLAYDKYAYAEFESELGKLNVVVPSLWHPQGGMRRGRARPDEIERAKLEGREPPPGLWFPGSLKELEALIYQQRIRLQKNPVLSSAVASATTNQDAFGNRWFDKLRATGRIDPLVALTMAVGAATRAVEPEQDISNFLKNPVTGR